MTTTEIFVRIALRVVIDETTDLPSLQDAIDGAACQVDVAGFRFDGELLVER